MDVINYSKIKKIETDLVAHKEDYTTQIKKLYCFIFDKIILGTELTWEMGSIASATGLNVISVQRIRNVGTITLTKGATIKLNDYSIFKFRVFRYDDANNYIDNSGYLTEDYIIQENCKIRILLSYQDDRHVFERVPPYDILEPLESESTPLLEIQTKNEGSDVYMNFAGKEKIMVYQRSTSIVPQAKFPDYESDTSLEFNEPVIIDRIDWQTNHRTMPAIYIEIKKGETWEYLTRIIARDNTTSKGGNTPEYIQVSKSGLWEILEFDNESVDKYFKFKLREPIYAPEGIRIYIKNLSTTTNYSGSLVVEGRKV